MSSSSSKGDSNKKEVDDDDLSPPPEFFANNDQLTSKMSTWNFRVRGKDYISTPEMVLRRRRQLLQCIQVLQLPLLELHPRSPLLSRILVEPSPEYLSSPVLGSQWR
ncbi:hypothetical protein GYMLUDRAFT_695470 [Collybiopsis luxurians FD-317 M1]|uniref:Uncharacterized protein n=1 Tax=Collybiopsis luxurians FD-317 M1 TaxID=944289 RepID=A0A0D0BSP3_9AGAR|nr:hypothetical protein GYMLUDRAFT_695470 [Collybiopsis luxurians FD-317 M1]